MPRKEPRPRKPCQLCGGAKPAGPGHAYCVSCSAARAARKALKPCRACGGPKPQIKARHLCDACIAAGNRARRPVPFVERFWERVNKLGSVPDYAPHLGRCWEWTGPLAKVGGHGQFTVDQRTYLAYRFSFELLSGPIPEGLTLDHLCRNRACVNPGHLEPVTNAENVRRAWAARRADLERSVAS